MSETTHKAKPRGVRRAVVACPAVTPATSEVLRAFHDSGMLARYETSFAYCADAWPDRVLRSAIHAVLGARATRQVQRRAVTGIPAALVKRSPGWDLVRTAAARLGAGDVVGDRLWEQMVSSFDAGVARRLGNEVDVLYGYEHACRRSFERAVELGVLRVFDMAAPHFSFSETLVAEQAQAFPEIVTAHWTATRKVAASRNAHKQAEFDLAQLIVANSTFTASTLLRTGYSADRVRVVPLGAPRIDGSWRERPEAPRTRFVFAGSLAPHKGVHHLLTAWSALGTSAADLVLAGEWALPQRLREGLPASVQILGRIPQTELFEQYRRASVLVFPSLCDGFGMVVTEALAHGLPVITTSNVGASDLLQNGENGWVLPPGDVDALTARMAWCLEHPAKLRAMRESAEATAAAHPWSEYRRRVVQTVVDAFERTGRE